MKFLARSSKEKKIELNYFPYLETYHLNQIFVGYPV